MTRSDRSCNLGQKRVARWKPTLGTIKNILQALNCWRNHLLRIKITMCITAPCGFLPNSGEMARKPGKQWSLFSCRLLNVLSYWTFSVFLFIALRITAYYCFPFCRCMPGNTAWEYLWKEISTLIFIGWHKKKTEKGIKKEIKKVDHKIKLHFRLKVSFKD